MFPWDHFAIGYVAFSLLSRLRRRRVDDTAFLAVVVGSQFPDLVDKPLAWTFGVLPSGTTLAHSVFVAVPTSVAAVLLASRFGRPRVGVGFGVAYLLHLPADVLYGPLTTGRPVEFGVLLWPLVPSVGSRAGRGLVASVVYYLSRYRTYLQSPEVMVFFVLEVTLLVLAVLLWVADGFPGTGTLRRAVRGVDT